MNRAVRLAWCTEAVCVALGVATLVLLALGVGTPSLAEGSSLGGSAGLTFLVASLAFSTVGALVAARVRGNPIGWIIVLTGLLLALGNFAFQYADYALSAASPDLPGASIAAWAQNVMLTPTLGLVAVSLLLFPDGRLPSRRWRPVLFLATAGSACIATSYALRPGPLDEPFARSSNPLAIDGAAGLADVLAIGWLLMAVGVGLAAVAMTVRLRRSRGHERQQLKWIALVATGAGVVVVANAASYQIDLGRLDELRDVALGLALAGFPVAAGIAILRHRLYDIDLVINRALVYTALTATLGGAYLALVLLIGLAAGESGVAVAASTLTVAALFGPARARIQAAVDRRFYRRRYDAARTLAAFSGRLRDELDLEALAGDLRAVVQETVQPAHVSLWLREAPR